MRAMGCDVLKLTKVFSGRRKVAIQKQVAIKKMRAFDAENAATHRGSTAAARSLQKFAIKRDIRIHGTSSKRHRRWQIVVIGNHDFVGGPPARRPRWVVIASQHFPQKNPPTEPSSDGSLEEPLADRLARFARPERFGTRIELGVGLAGSSL